MRRIFALLLVLSLVLPACSLSTLQDLIQMPTPTLEGTPAPTDLPTSTSTIIPTQPTPTFTATPTLIYNAQEPFIPTVPPNVGTPFIPPLVPTPVGTSRYTGFVSVVTAGRVIYWGICEPNYTTITATVEDPERVFSVIIFIRLKDKKYEDETKWSRGAAMDKQDGGVFTYKLRSKKIDDYGHFFHAWVLYQLVATDRDGMIIGRTPVMDKDIVLEACP